MKPVDYVLCVISVVFFIIFLGGLSTTPAIVFQLKPVEVWTALGRRLFYAVLPALIVLWRVWG